MGTLLEGQNKTDAETVHLGSVSVKRSDCCEDRDDRQISRWGTNTDPTQSYQTFSQHKTGELSLSTHHLPNGSYKNGGALRDFFTSKFTVLSQFSHQLHHVHPVSSGSVHPRRAGGSGCRPGGGQHRRLETSPRHLLPQVPHRFLRLHGAATDGDQEGCVLLLPRDIQSDQLPRHRSGHPHHGGGVRGGVRGGGGLSARCGGGDSAIRGHVRGAEQRARQECCWAAPALCCHPGLHSHAHH